MASRDERTHPPESAEAIVSKQGCNRGCDKTSGARANRWTCLPVAELVQRQDRRLSDIPTEQRKDVRRRSGRANGPRSLKKCLSGRNGSFRNAGVLKFAKRREVGRKPHRGCRRSTRCQIHPAQTFWSTGGNYRRCTALEARWFMHCWR